MRSAEFLIALCLAGAVVAPLRGEPLPLDTRPVGLSAEDDGVTWVGALRYRGGLEIRSGDPRFGGLSGLLVEADGSRFRAVGDKGYWVTAALRHDRDDRLAGVTSGRIGALRSADGRSVAGTRRADAEALARTGRGLAVAFEGRHRISVYPISLTARPLPLATPDGLRRAPANGGIEALATLGDGRLLAISERFAIDGRHVRAWLRDRRGWHP